MSKYLKTTHRNIAWFKKIHDEGNLLIKPPFQRNPVWTNSQKSYLIDSILNGFPVPELYMQELVDEKGIERYVVIDGQQRIRTCLEFVGNSNFVLSEEDSPKWGGMTFEDLTSEDKKAFYSYSFLIRVLPEISDDEIRGIFQRLNKNVVALNAQELRQATYWGPFIKTMQEIANYPYWSTSGIFTPINVRRMMDVEYVSELAIAVLHGHQNKKETLDYYYQVYEQEFEERESLIEKFQKVLFEIEQVFPDIKIKRWRKKTDFYSLFTFMASHVMDLPLPKDKRSTLRSRLDDFAEHVDVLLSTSDDVVNDNSVDSPYVEYAKAVRASSDVGNRRRRHRALERSLGDLFTNTNVSVATKIQPLQRNLFELDDLEDNN